MLRLRLFESEGEVRVWLCDEAGTGLRELRDPIGGLPGSIDWGRSVESCRAIGEEGLEVDLVFDDA